jgi:hypothetical protein
MITFGFGEYAQPNQILKLYTISEPLLESSVPVAVRLENVWRAGHQWLTPIILEIRRIEV